VTSAAVRGKRVGRALIEEFFAIALNLASSGYCRCPVETGCASLFDPLAHRNIALGTPVRMRSTTPQPVRNSTKAPMDYWRRPHTKRLHVRGNPLVDAIEKSSLIIS
jgi:hypothetical protein